MLVGDENVDEDLSKKLHLKFKDDDINRILKVKNMDDSSLRTKKQKIEHLMKNDGIGEEILNHLDSLKGCSINSLKDSIYRIDGNLSKEFRDCNSIPAFLSYLFKFNLLDCIPLISGLSKFSSTQTTKFTKVHGDLNYSDPKADKQKIEADLSSFIERENERRDRHVQIKNIEINEGQKIIIIDLLIEQGRVTRKQFGFRGENSTPEDYSLNKVTIYPVNEKMIKVDYGKNEITTTITNQVDLVLYKKIIKCLYAIKQEEKIAKVQYITGVDTEEIKGVIEKRIKSSISELKKKKPLTEFDKKKLEIFQKIKIKELGIIAKDAPFEGGMSHFSLIAGEDFPKLKESMGIGDIVNKIFENSRDIDIIIEYNDQQITITREKWEGRNLSEIEREVLDALLRKE